MFSFWDLMSCGGVMLLQPNWGKFKSFVTSWKEPEPAAQAHAELSSVAGPPPPDLARLESCRQLSHPREPVMAFTSSLASAHRDPQ